VKYVLDKRKLLTAPPDTTVLEASRRMRTKNAGAVLIVEQDKVVGIFTERDVVFRVVAQGRDAKATRVAEVMTPSPKTIGPDASFGYAMIQMQKNGFRHLPVIEDGRPIGIVSARNALDPDLEEFVFEAQRRKRILEAG
jgi:CBS domain-containing protein